MKKTFYEVLGVIPTGSQEEIRAAYKRCAMKYHPDRNKDIDTTEVMKEVNIAFDTLSNPEKKIVYDSTFMYHKNIHEMDWKTLADLIQRVVSCIPSLSKSQPSPHRATKKSCSFATEVIKITVDVKISELCAVPQVIKKINVKVIRFLSGGAKKRTLQTNTIYVPTRNYISALTNTLKGQGDEIIPGVFGDIEVNLRVLPDAQYSISANNPYDLIFTKHVTLFEYYYGGSEVIIITHIDGSNTIEIDDYKGGETVKIVKGSGIPFINDDSQQLERGDLHVVFKLTVPRPEGVSREILDDVRQALEQLSSFK